MSDGVFSQLSNLLANSELRRKIRLSNSAGILVMRSAEFCTELVLSPDLPKALNEVLQLAEDAAQKADQARKAQVEEQKKLRPGTVENAADLFGVPIDKEGRTAVRVIDSSHDRLFR